MNIRFVFVKDRDDKNELTIEYCPTYQMLADYFTKSLQGKSFYAYREVLMRWKHISSLKQLTSPAMKERVGNLTQSHDQYEQIYNKKSSNDILNLIPENVQESHYPYKQELLIHGVSNKHVTWDLNNTHTQPQMYSKP